MTATSVVSLRHVVAQHWWVMLLRGLAGIALGLLAFFRPGMTLATLVLAIAICCFFDGIAAIAGGITGRFWQSSLIGVVSLLAALGAFLYPGLTALMLLYLIALWAIARGVFEILAAIEFRKVIDNELLLGLAGLMSIAFGVLIILRPGAGALSIIWLLGAYAFLSGIALVILSFRLKALA